MKKKLEISIKILFSFLPLFYSLNASSLSEPVSTATDKVQLFKNTTLFMPSKIDPECANKKYELCFPNTKLLLINKKGKHDLSKIISQWEGSFYIYFIKIAKDKYAVDLDHDGFPEVAIFPMVAGNAPFAIALIVTVKRDQIFHYGAGTFYWENGKHVIKIKKGKKWE